MRSLEVGGSWTINAKSYRLCHVKHKSMLEASFEVPHKLHRLTLRPHLFAKVRTYRGDYHTLTPGIEGRARQERRSGSGETTEVRFGYVVAWPLPPLRVCWPKIECPPLVSMVSADRWASTPVSTNTRESAVCSITSVNSLIGDGGSVNESLSRFESAHEALAIRHADSLEVEAPFVVQPQLL